MHQDGRVEVRAVGGNARLVLSASCTSAEVDYAAAAAADDDKATTLGWRVGYYDGDTQSSDRRDTREGVRKETYRMAGTATSTGVSKGRRRVWVTRQLLVGSSSSSLPLSPVPPEFSFALQVALQASPSPVASHAGLLEGAGDGKGVEEGGGVFVGNGEVRVVISDLPLPEAIPDHAR